MGVKIDLTSGIAAQQQKNSNIFGSGTKTNDKDVFTQAKEAKAKQTQELDTLKKAELQTQADGIDTQIKDYTTKLGQSKEGSDEYNDIQNKINDLNYQKTGVQGELDNATKALNTEIKASPRFNVES